MMTMTNGKIDKDRLKAHANKHITKLLDALNIAYTERGPLYQAKCPIHDHPGDGDNSTAFSWKESANGWVCWTHGCDQKWGGDIFGLVCGVLDINFGKAVEFVFDVLTNKLVDLEAEIIPPKRMDPSIPRVHKPIPEQCLQFLDEKYNVYPLDMTLIQRGFDPWVLRKFQVGFWHQFGTFMNDRLIFPIRDHQGFLVGFTGRTVFPKNKWESRNVKSKWIHGRHFSHWPSEKEKLLTGSILFNLHRAKDHCHNGEIILVEGPLDGLKLEQAGIHNWSAILGVKNFSPAHRTLLIQSGISKLILALDPDQAGCNGANAISKIVKDFFHVEKIILPGVDPGDMLIDDIKKVF